MFLYWIVYQKGYNGSIRQLITTKTKDYFYKTDFYEFNFYEIVITDNHIVDKHILCEDEEGRIIRKMIEEYSWNIIDKIGEKSCLISIGNLDVQFNVLSFMIYSCYEIKTFIVLNECILNHLEAWMIMNVFKDI